MNCHYNKNIRYNYVVVQQRKQLRLKRWDYGQGWYFVTICVKSRKCVLGEVQKNIVVLSQSGNIVEKCLRSLPMRYTSIAIPDYVIMPNHVHLVVAIKQMKEVGTIHELSLQKNMRTHMPLANVVGYLKTQTAKDINIIHGTQGKPFWQRSYYEHIIRDGKDYQEICAYIRNNPRNWYEDSLYVPK